MLNMNGFYLPFNAKFCENPTKENEYLKDKKLFKTLVEKNMKQLK